MHKSRFTTVIIAVTLVALILLIAREIRGPTETPEQTAARKERKRQVALKKALDICKGIKRLYQAGLVKELQSGYWVCSSLPEDPRVWTTIFSDRPEDCPNWVHLRKRCLDLIEQYSREAYEWHYFDKPTPHAFRRNFVVYVLRQFLEKRCLCVPGCRPASQRFSELCRKEAIRSGAEHDPKYPRYRIYKGGVVFRPGFGVSAKEIAPLVEAVIKEGYIYKVAILPPFTREEERKFLKQLKSQKKN